MSTTECFRCGESYERLGLHYTRGQCTIPDIDHEYGIDLMEEGYVLYEHNARDGDRLLIEDGVVKICREKVKGEHEFDSTLVESLLNYHEWVPVERENIDGEFLERAV